MNIRKRINRIITAVTLSAGMLAGLTACSEDEEPEIPPVPEKVGRTVLVYMVANNNLGDGTFENGIWGYDGLDLEEMKVAAQNGSFGDNRLIVYHVPRYGDVAIKEVTRRGEIRVLETLDREEYSTSAARMSRVIASVKRLSPADNYGLVLWSHGSGWIEDGIKENVPSKGDGGALRSFGSDNGRTMNISTLADVLEGEGFDYVYFDCCHMASVEVAYELRHATQAIVGSVSELPSKGMPYDKTLRYLMPDEPDLIGAATSVFETYDALAGWDRTCTMSVISTAGMDGLAEAVRNMMRMASKSVNYSGVQLFRNGWPYYDLENYLEKLALANEGSDEALAEAKRWIEEGVLYKAATPYLWQADNIHSSYDEVEIKHHCGLSTNIVWREGQEITNNYDRLEWWRNVASELWRK